MVRDHDHGRPTDDRMKTVLQPGICLSKNRAFLMLQLRIANKTV
jgi:hypothetical protein